MVLYLKEPVHVNSSGTLFKGTCPRTSSSGTLFKEPVHVISSGTLFKEPVHVISSGTLFKGICTRDFKWFFI